MILARERGAYSASVASSFPPNQVGTSDTIRALLQVFPDQDPEFVTNLVERSGVESRSIVPTVAEVSERSRDVEVLLP